mgnify:CR=1 FL=1
MPQDEDVRYRVKRTPKGAVRLAFKGVKVVEAKKMHLGPPPEAKHA